MNRICSIKRISSATIRHGPRGKAQVNKKLDICALTRRNLLKVSAALAAVGALPLAVASAKAAAARPLRIGIIGSGHVGSALGGVWAKAGNEVMFSSRNLDNDKQVAAGVGDHARAGSPEEAAAFGQVLLFAVPYGALPALAKSLG